MATPANAADFGNALINANLDMRKMAFSPRGQQLLTYINSPQATFIRDNCDGDTIDTRLWTATNAAGATAFAAPAAASAVSGGSYAGATGTTSGDGLALYGHPIFSGDLNAGMLVTWQSDIVTSLLFEQGFADPLTGYTTAGALSDIDTPSIGNGAVTVAILGMDTTQTLTTAALVLDGDATYATTKVQPSTAWSPTAATRYTTVIQTMGDYARCAVFSGTTQAPVKVFDISTTALAFEGGTLVHPYVFFQTKNTTSKAIQLFRIWAWGDKP